MRTQAEPGMVIIMKWLGNSIQANDIAVKVCADLQVNHVLGNMVDYGARGFHAALSTARFGQEQYGKCQEEGTKFFHDACLLRERKVTKLGYLLLIDFGPGNKKESVIFAAQPAP